MFRLNSKALSPVIGSIILIAVTVAVSIAVAVWMGALSIGFMKPEQVIITGASFQGTTNKTIQLIAKNSGTSPVTINEVWVNGAKQNYTAQSFQANAPVNVTVSYNWITNDKYEIKLVSADGNQYLYPATAVPQPVNLNPISSGWHYSKSHVINSQSGAGTGYQIRIVVHLGSGSDIGENVYLNGKCQADFDDIRFVGSDGTTFLDYWLESSNEEEAVFWVRLNDDLDMSSSTIYVYYGNNAVASMSDGASTFPTLFTDFEGDSLPEGWQVDGDTFGTMSIENSLLKLTGDSSSSGSWKYRGVKTSSPVWGNDQALMYRVDAINYYPNNNRHLWYLGGEATNYYVEFNSYGDKVNVRDYNIIDYYNPANWAGGEIVWLAKQSGNNGNAFYYLNGTLMDIIDGAGLHPAHQFPALTVYFKASQGANTIPSVDYVYIDWVAIRKFAYPEPVHGGWGEEVII